MSKNEIKWKIESVNRGFKVSMRSTSMSEPDKLISDLVENFSLTKEEAEKRVNKGDIFELRRGSETFTFTPPCSEAYSFKTTLIKSYLENCCDEEFVEIISSVSDRMCQFEGWYND